MKSLAIKIISIIFIGFAIISCSQNSSNQLENKTISFAAIDKSKNDTATFDKTASILKSDFEIAKFIKLSDSLLTTLQGQPIHLSCSIDTITADQSGRFFNALFTSNNTTAKRYSFSPGKGNRKLDLWFLEVTYQDTISATKAFFELQNDAYEKGKRTGYDWTPGLTYSNDYVIKTDRKIYWLNTGCSYAFYNHQKIKQFILQCLQTDHITDSIYCKCGQAQCNLLEN